MEQHEIDHRSMSLGTLTLVQKKFGCVSQDPTRVRLPWSKHLARGLWPHRAGAQESGRGQRCRSSKARDLFLRRVLQVQQLDVLLLRPGNNLAHGARDKKVSKHHANGFLSSRTFSFPFFHCVFFACFCTALPQRCNLPKF